MALRVVAAAVLVFSLFSFFVWRLQTWPAQASWHPSHTEPAQTKPRPASTRPNAWLDLTTCEAQEVYKYLSGNLAALTSIDGQSASNTTINWLEAIRPNKSDIISATSDVYGTSAKYAKVSTTQIINNETWFNYYSVGPLPLSSNTTIEPLAWPYGGKRAGVKSPLLSFQALQAYGLELAVEISDITRQLLHAQVKPEDRRNPDSLTISGRATYIEDGTAFIWLDFRRPGPRSSAWSILPQGLYAKLKVDTQSPKPYKPLSWYYNGLCYDSADELRHAMRNPDFVRAVPNLDGDWTTIEDLTDNEERKLAPPVMVQPQGPRYKLDRKEQYVSYMGWTFYFTSYLSTGPALFDIRFRGTKVMYELALNEALAHYAGDDPIQGGQEFLDAAFGMGRFAFELVPGYDCPIYADYVDVTHHAADEELINKNSICLFEYTADHLLQRHTSRYQVTVSRNTYLIFRTVSTVGNYDYTIDYIFYLDGTLEVKVRASGFIFGAYHSNTTVVQEGHPPGAKADKYGYRIHDAIDSSMHDHVISFRADVDIAGVENTFTRTAIEPIRHSYAWEKPEIPERNTMRLKDYPVNRETGLNWPANSGEMYIIGSLDKTNAWGETRTYRIAPGTGMGAPPHLTIANSTSLGKSARWAEKDIWVLRRKDVERSSADPVNWFSPLDPLLDFDDAADGETLLISSSNSVSVSRDHDTTQIDRDDDAHDGDLVLYFNLGAHHVPHSGDLPNTLMHTSASSVMFIPHNFNDRDPSRLTSQGVRVALVGNNGAGGLAKQHPGGRKGMQSGPVGKREMAYFGGRYEAGVELSRYDLEPDLSGYDGGKRGTDLSYQSSMFGGVGGDGVNAQAEECPVR